MSMNIAASLNEHQRDALLSYYLGQYVPASGNPDLTNRVQTPEDVYEYLLMDPQISNAVPTTRVAQAISGIQQYINAITMNMEPGYQTQKLDQKSISDWNDGLSQYDVWAGKVVLDTYPENYISPVLRSSRTRYFNELITELNQNTLDSDTALQAVLNYLNKFEQVANLSIVSGYLESTDPTKGVYYFLGKSRDTSAKYFGRAFAMHKNLDNVVAADAWSEWFPVNISINEEARVGIPRLVYFNNRIYLFWFERSKGGNNTDVTDITQAGTYDIITAYSSCCDLSNNWSSPQSLLSVKQNDNAGYCDGLFTADYLNTACTYNPTDDCMTISLYAGDSYQTGGTETLSDFSVSIDYWSNLAQIQAGRISDNSLLIQYLSTYLENKSIKSKQNKVQPVCSLITKPVVISSARTTNATDPFGGNLTLPDFVPSDFETSGGALANWSVSMALHFSDTRVLKHYLNQLLQSDSTLIGSARITEFIQSGAYHESDMVTLSLDAGRSPLTIDNAIYIYGQKSFPLTISPAITLPSPGNAVIPEYALGDSVDRSTTFQFKYYQGSTLRCMTPEIGFDSGTSGSPWFFQFKVDSTPGCWQKGAIFYSVTRDEFHSTDPALKITFNQFTVQEMTAGKATRYFALGYTDNGGYTCYQEYQLDIANQPAIPVTPIITSGIKTEDGSAIYLDFTGMVFADNTPIAPVRMNTLFVKKLINIADKGIQALLDWDTQLTPEPPMITDGSGAATPMDFSGANGLYFWELFFHMPYLVAWRLHEEQKHSDALDWYHYIFDPAARGRDNSSVIRTKYPEPDYWSIRPLVENSGAEARLTAIGKADDPDALAMANPVRYKKNIFMAYIKTLMAVADANYRVQSPDSLSLARLQYGQVRNLLGPRPDSVIASHWAPEILGKLSAGSGVSTTLMNFEHQTPALPPLPGQLCAADSVVTHDKFMTPVNSQLLGYWDTLDSRLYNLQHWLSIDGQPLSIPLYAPLLNPELLTSKNMQGSTLFSTTTYQTQSVLPFRFTILLQSARAAVATLGQFGQTLLSYCERQDATGLQELDMQQLFNLSGYTLQLQQNAIDAMDKDQTSLEKSREMAQQRLNHYQMLYDQNLSAGEIAATALQVSSATTLAVASPLISAGMIMRTIPNIFGMAVGGQDVGAPTLAVGMAMQLAGETLGISARQTEISEGYRRRREEWNIQSQQAQSETDVINAQLDALAVRRTGAVTALNLAKQQQDNLKTTLNFLTTRFTQSALYNWLTGQLSALYYQAYDATVSLCLRTEACWQYEMGDITTRFIQTGTWNDSYRGLLVGETLQLNLQQMESAWLNRYTRRLEITKTISLKNLPDFDLKDLKDNGKASFSLTESLFDDDYPGHYLRQIKSITVTLPALVGPYQDVRMTLTQSGSRVLLKPDINGVSYLNDPTKGSASNILTNPRASQQVAVSSGLNDAGLFVLNFGDERYLPFEGTGAVSDWQIAFPNPTSPEQKALLTSLNDVIIQVHYTAVYGGSSFEQSVISMLQG
ncbi:hypothetical protein YI53_003914 [Salmonella enterica subsp. enterica]|nr:hypothetical protein [Salmonella enterica subsp. enterica]